MSTFGVKLQIMIYAFGVLIPPFLKEVALSQRIFKKLNNQNPSAYRPLPLKKGDLRPNA
jgi:hypothetical protein